jgi:hypothetical protein
VKSRKSLGWWSVDCCYAGHFSIVTAVESTHGAVNAAGVWRPSRLFVIGSTQILVLLLKDHIPSKNAASRVCESGDPFSVVPW